MMTDPMTTALAETKSLLARLGRDRDALAAALRGVLEAPGTRVAPMQIGAAYAALRGAGEPMWTVGALGLCGPLEPRETDPRLLWLLRVAGEEWGPLGVALAAAGMTDRAALIARLSEPASARDRVEPSR